MTASPAQIEANRRNAARSTGPKTPEGKARSRGNSYKHGLTGDGVVLPEEDAAEVERLARAFRAELDPPGEVGDVLVRRMALLSVRMARCVEQETAALSDRVRAALDDFEAPEGADAEQAARLRAEAGRRAMFDPSKEACLARKYEAAAERSFFRSLREIRQLRKESSRSPASEIEAQARASLARLGSFLQAEAPARPTPPKPSPPASPAPPAPSRPLPAPSPAWNPADPGHFDLPFAIGLAR